MGTLCHAGNALLFRRLQTHAAPGEALTPNSVAGGKIATNAIVNRHLTSGSVQETTCDSTIQGYFADAIYANKIATGSAYAEKLYADNLFGTHLNATDLAGRGFGWALATNIPSGRYVLVSTS